MISTFELKLIHEIFKDVTAQYPDKLVRFQYFLATCLYLDADFNLDFVSKNRLYGSLIRIDNSSLDKHLKQFKLLRLHATLHDAAGYLQEKNHTGPEYPYVLPFNPKPFNPKKTESLFFNRPTILDMRDLNAARNLS